MPSITGDFRNVIVAMNDSQVQTLMMKKVQTRCRYKLFINPIKINFLVGDWKSQRNVLGIEMTRYTDS